MPRYIFPAGSVTNTTGSPLRLTFYATSTTNRREVDLWTVDGSSNLSERIPNGVVVADTTGAYSAFAGPDDFDTLYLNPHTGVTRTQITATSVIGGGNSILTVGSSNGRDDTLAIQALLSAARLNGGGRVIGLPGQTYYLSAPLVIGSNTTLDMTGCVVTLKTSTTVNLLNNYALANASTVQDGAISASSAALVCATSTPFSGAVVVGTPVTVWGAGVNGQPLVTTVSAIADSGHVTLATAASVTVSGAPVSIGTRDHDITIIGGTWRTNGQRGTLPPQGDLIRLRRVDRVEVRDVVMDDTGFHGVCFGDAMNFTVSGFRMAVLPPIQMDGIHLHGPLDGGVIRNTQGYGASAMISICPNDYVGSNDVYGPVTNLDIDSVHLEPPNTGVPVAMNGGSNTSGTSCRFIRVRNISGVTSNFAGMVMIGDDTASANTTGGLISDIVVENVTGIVNNANSCLVGIQGTLMGRVRVSGITAENANQAFTVGLVWVKSTTSATNLTVENADISSLSSSAAVCRVDGAVTQVIVDRVRSAGNTTYALLVHGSAANITRALVSNLALASGSPVQVDNASATCPHITISDAQGVGGYGLGDIAITTEVHAVNVQSQPTANILNIGAAAAVITLYATNCSFNSKTLQGTAGGKVRSRGIGLPIDVTSTFLQNNAGDLAYHTNASAAPFVVGPVVADGTAWRPMLTGAVKTGTATLVAGTVTVSDSSITTTSVIRVTHKTNGGTPGALYISAKVASTSFTITSTSGTDTSLVQYDVLSY